MILIDFELSGARMFKCWTLTCHNNQLLTQVSANAFLFQISLCIQMFLVAKTPTTKIGMGISGAGYRGIRAANGPVMIHTTREIFELVAEE